MVSWVSDSWVRGVSGVSGLRVIEFGLVGFRLVDFGIGGLGLVDRVCWRSGGLWLMLNRQTEGLSL